MKLPWNCPQIVHKKSMKLSTKLSTKFSLPQITKPLCCKWLTIGSIPGSVRKKFSRYFVIFVKQSQGKKNSYTQMLQNLSTKLNLKQSIKNVFIPTSCFIIERYYRIIPPKKLSWNCPWNCPRKCLLLMPYPHHCGFLEHWNSQKSFTSIRQHFFGCVVIYLVCDLPTCDLPNMWFTYMWFTYRTRAIISRSWIQAIHRAKGHST